MQSIVISSISIRHDNKHLNKNRNSSLTTTNGTLTFTSPNLWEINTMLKNRKVRGIVANKIFIK